jgi:hypothetical protein
MPATYVTHTEYVYYWRALGGVYHAMARQPGKRGWFSLCHFFAAARIRGRWPEPPRPRRQECSLCRLAAERIVEAA